MKKNLRNDHRVRKVNIRPENIWPDLYERENRFFEKDNDRFLAIGIMVMIILILLFVIGCQIGRIIEISRMTSDVEAAEVVTDDYLPRQVALADVVDQIITPTAQEAIEGILELPNPTIADGSFKTRLDWMEITKKDSAQYQLQQLSWTDADGFRRYEQYYLVALGMYYSNTIGTTFEVILSSGRVIDCMLGEVKHPKDTDPSRKYVESNGNILEFIVDKAVMDPDAYNGGNMSVFGFKGSVISIRKVDFE